MRIPFLLLFRPKDLKESYYNLQAREHLRKKLIGKKVGVTVNYIKPAEGEFEEKTCATVLLGELYALSLFFLFFLPFFPFPCHVHLQRDSSVGSLHFW